MKPLEGKRAYLSGPIEYDDSGHDWRPAVKEELFRRFGIDIYDPFTDPKQAKADELTAAKEAEDFDKVTDIVHRFVRKDLDAVDRSNMLIANLPYKVPTVGTVHEIINANDRKKPTLLVCTKGKKYIPAWYFGFVPHDQMFGSWRELYDFLEDVNAGKYADRNRWWLIYDMI